MTHFGNHFCYCAVTAVNAVALVTLNSEYQSEGKVKIFFEGIFKEYVSVYE